MASDGREHERPRGHLRPSGFDELGLRRAMGDRMLPFVVAAMAFLAALGLAGWVGAAALARHWQTGPAAALTVQVPDPSEHAAGGQRRIERALAALQAAPGVAEARIVSPEELADLLRPWLGDTGGVPALPLPGVIAVRLSNPDQPVSAVTSALAEAVPQASVDSDGVWVGRLARLARSLQACAGAALLALTGVAVAVVMVATRAGIAARRDAIEIVHGLGASDGYIAGRFARRATALATAGATMGALVAAPVLFALAELAAPFVPGDAAATPAGLWMLLPALPLGAAAVGFLTAQATVRNWLRQLQ